MVENWHSSVKVTLKKVKSYSPDYSSPPPPSQTSGRSSGVVLGKILMKRNPRPRVSITSVPIFKNLIFQMIFSPGAASNLPPQSRWCDHWLPAAFFIFSRFSKRSFFLNPHLFLFLLLKLVPLSIIGFLDSCDVGQDPPVQKVARREVFTRNRLKHYVYTSICVW